MAFTHFNSQGHAHMVDVSEKDKTARTARAKGKIFMRRDTLELVHTGGIQKGDVLSVAQVAGIMAAKRTWEIIPMCHPIQLTGVEMEALTAASTACLTIYDMCKAHQRDMVIDQICLLEKDGGASGHFVREEQNK